MSNIFKYIGKRDLIEFNTVCKKWNNATNPIIHKTIKLQRKRAFQNKDHDKRFVKSAKTDAEVEMCIINNSKHAQYIKELSVCENLKPQRAIQLFETFRFITTLSIGGNMNQDQFIGMVIPLTQLQELKLYYLSIKGLKKNKYATGPAVLPPSLKKLTIEKIRLCKSPVLFIQTINSHTSLLEFKFDSFSHDSNNEVAILDPFFKSYPSLKIFEYSNQHLDYSQSLIKIFESNSQLRTLKLSFSGCNDVLMSNLSRHLTNLEEFNFNELNSYNESQASIISKFTHLTKIKKLNLNWRKLSQCSINSILLNCPYLEELYLKYSPSYQNNVSDISINPSKLANIKKLNLRYGNLSTNSYDSIITKCAQVKELDIELPREWKECMKVIGRTCTDLERLVIYPSYYYGQDIITFYQEFYETELLACNSLYKSTLKHLTLKNFNIYESKIEYFKNFSKLKCIEYPWQRNSNGSTSNTEVNFDKDLWPGYRVEIKSCGHGWDAKLHKLSSQTQ
ncbi:RNI-like protein [Conidiobolus coronatus NRRL 28638]|uniref:RNI-like protein n=1 Tax=Conidiobolus coronatus (strain ATCC 28846 / CBS 209.66 / NRRL 28638) TaxID=796925 RepID=A0A137NQD5_CONC2|nr:RNI-like protein [Conidiobolus coronatus NRRL 28638]|eukprot:KXN64928.1 RNI-like protein [Conidiobolus coronatus NRRL 28638]